MNKLVLLSCVAAVVACVAAQADRYPAGLNPALCPGYPNCDNALLALYSAGAIPEVPQAIDVSEINGVGGDRYPAGVPAAACPNYPFCNVGEAGAGLPLPGFAQRLYPAGVPAAACPNYPYC